MEPIARPAVYTVPQVAFLLETTPWNVYEMIKRDEVPGVIRIGSKIRVLRSIFNRVYGLDDEVPLPS